MKVVIFLSFCLALVAAKPYGGYEGETRLLRVEEPFVPIRSFLSKSDNYGTYAFETESADGTSMQESGNLKNVNNELVSVKSGSYEWTSPEGERFHVDYTADELGFHPVMTRLSGAPLAARVLPAPLVREEFVQRAFPAPIAFRGEINSYGQPAPAIRIPAPIVREEIKVPAPIVREEIKVPAPIVREEIKVPAPIVREEIKVPAPIVREELVNSYAPEPQLVRVPAPAVDTIRFGTFSEPLRFPVRVEAPLLNRLEAPLVLAGTTRFGLPGTQTWGDFETPEFTILSSNPSNTFVRIGLP